MRASIVHQAQQHEAISILKFAQNQIDQCRFTRPIYTKDPNAACHINAKGFHTRLYKRSFLGIASESINKLLHMMPCVVDEDALLELIQKKQNYHDDMSIAACTCKLYRL
ncbi:hypothetical protein THRCLA_21963 [Thraustotheca clavata]|uniref:Uncharacterized protein n=1 Tax=Thraustotheca clavata TaxID=74557 RepID=A0A1V9ZH04_9STRA|nr:hypothetical protein THRCLA_21963 [Thraustotheca clavata]